MLDILKLLRVLVFASAVWAIIGLMLWIFTLNAGWHMISPIAFVFGGVVIGVGSTLIFIFSGKDKD